MRNFTSRVADITLFNTWILLMQKTTTQRVYNLTTHIWHLIKLNVVCVTLLAVLVMDLFFSFGYMHSNQTMNLSWVLHFSAKGSGLDLEIIPKV